MGVALTLEDRELQQRAAGMLPRALVEAMELKELHEGRRWPAREPERGSHRVEPSAAPWLERLHETLHTPPLNGPQTHRHLMELTRDERLVNVLAENGASALIPGTPNLVVAASDEAGILDLFFPGGETRLTPPSRQQVELRLRSVGEFARQGSPLRIDSLRFTSRTTLQWERGEGDARWLIAVSPGAAIDGEVLMRSRLEDGRDSVLVGPGEKGRVCIEEPERSKTSTESTTARHAVFNRELTLVPRELENLAASCVTPSTYMLSWPWTGGRGWYAVSEASGSRWSEVTGGRARFETSSPATKLVVLQSEASVHRHREAGWDLTVVSDDPRAPQIAGWAVSAAIWLRRHFGLGQSSILIVDAPGTSMAAGVVVYDVAREMALGHARWVLCHEVSHLVFPGEMEAVRSRRILEPWGIEGVADYLAGEMCPREPPRPEGLTRLARLLRPGGRLVRPYPFHATLDREAEYRGVWRALECLERQFGAPAVFRELSRLKSLTQEVPDCVSWLGAQMGAGTSEIDSSVRKALSQLTASHQVEPARPNRRAVRSRRACPAPGQELRPGAAP